MKSLFVKLNTLLFFLIAFEAVTMGSGQMVHVFGPLTLKMFLFLIAFLFFVIKFCDKPVRHEGNKIAVFAFVVFCIGALMHFVYSFDNINMIFNDLKTVSYVFICLYFAFTIRKKDTVDLFIKILKLSALIMSVVYLVYLYLILISHYLNFDVIYSLYSVEMEGQLSDIMFRDRTGILFYKGFLFLPIGFLFYFSEKKYLPALIILIAIFMTKTRGFYVMTVAAIFLYYFLLIKKFSNKILILLVVTFLALLAIMYMWRFSSVERIEGDIIRLTTFSQVFNQITPISFLFGHGFGNGVPIRPVHMENSFLEIFHKQGILGLSFWLYIFILIRNKYRSVRDKANKKTAVLLFVGVLIIYLQTNFNPFMNNPIGLFFILTTYFSLWTLHKEEVKLRLNNNILGVRNGLFRSCSL